MQKIYSIKSMSSLSGGEGFAYRYRHSEVLVPHLLLSLINNGSGDVSDTLRLLGIDVEKFQNLIEERLILSNISSWAHQSDVLKRVLPSEGDSISEGDLFLTCLDLEPDLIDIDRERFLSLFPKQTKEDKDPIEDEFVEEKEASEEEEFLLKHCTDLTEVARLGKLDPVIGRDSEIRRVIRTLLRRTKNNPTLVGEPGVGKTSIVEGLAQRIVSKDVPETLSKKRLLSLDLGSLVAGTKYRGDFEERLKKLMDIISNQESNIILFIDEIHNIVGAGSSEGSMDAGNILKPLLARGEIKVVGATTKKEYSKYISKDMALERRFQPIYVEEPSKDATIAILRGLKEKFEVFHGVKITDSAIVSSVTLSSRYIKDRFLPDKAIDLIDEAAATVRTEIDSMPSKLDEVVRKIMQLQIEKKALKNDPESCTKDKLAHIENKLEELIKKRKKIEEQWNTEKHNIDDIKDLKQKIEEVNLNIATNERQYNLDKVAQLKYEELAQLEKLLAIKESRLEKSGGKLVKERVTDNEIASVISKWTKIPKENMINYISGNITSIYDKIVKDVIGQDRAVKAVTESILRAQSGLRDGSKPMGSFLFLGPLGVGKAGLVKSLAKTLFGDNNGVITLNMGDYIDKFSLDRIIGSTTNTEDVGCLLEKVRKEPYSIIVLEEIEKAHPSVVNVIFKIMEDGSATDIKGREVDFRNTIIVLISNAGSNISKSDITDIQAGKGEVYKELRDFFKPELLNRVDDIIVFSRLAQGKIREIAAKYLEGINKKMASRNIKIIFDDKVIDYIAKKGYDNDYGVGPMKKVIQSIIETDLANKLLIGEITNNSLIKMSRKGSSWTYDIKKIHTNQFYESEE